MTRAEALEAIIALWAKNMQAQTPDEVRIALRDNALCREFFWQAQECVGCPVAASTGENYCVGSPFAAAHTALWNWLNDPTPEKRAAFIAAATAEHDFLVSLRETVA